MDLFVNILIILINVICISMQQNCDKNGLNRLDSNVAKIITIGNTGRDFPENKDEELRNYCNETKFYIEEVNDYKTRCLKDLPRQIIGIAIYTIKKTMDHLCKQNPKYLKQLDVFIMATPCINLADPEIMKCYNKFFDELLGAQNELNDNKKLPYLCCSYYKLFPCLEYGMNRVKHCNSSHIETFDGFIKSIFGDAITILCTDYNDESDKCERLGSPPRKRLNQRRSKSFIIPFIDLIANFKEI